LKFYFYAQPFAASLAEMDDGIRFAGSDPQRFQRLLVRMTEYAVQADEAGFEGMCWSEQHANVEGIPENTTNPILLGAHMGARTTRLKVGQLGMTLSANHPLRIAEDLAILDQLTNGRMFCGFTRGNATRWVNTYGQYYGVTATESDKSKADEVNLRAIQEAWLIIKSAWTKDTFRVDGEFWQVPGRDIHWGYEPTLKHGGGMDPDGTLVEMGIAPRPLQSNPRVFGPISRRLTTAKFWASEGGTAVSYADDDDFLKMAAGVLAEEAAASGHKDVAALAPGAFLILGKTQEEAAELRAGYEDLFKRFYSIPPFNVPMGRVLFGTVDDVSRQIEDLQKIADFEELFVWHNIGTLADDLERSAFDLFSEKVLPRFN
jgi:alkanesulfonate monooxygenase SsuD/methylene tetrahydromethanopterin reductase-like flavin-dependent oxidoreductase (luciferase family)